MLRAELRVIEGKHQGKSLPLNVKQFLVGREADCHLRPNSDMVSRHHCVFIIDEYAVRVRDLGSTNGTYVNGERIQGQVVLKEGDRIDIGKLAFQLAIRKLAPVSVAAPVQPAYQEPEPVYEEPEPVYEEPAYEENTAAGSATMSFDSGEIPVYEQDSRTIAESDTAFHSPPPAPQPPAPKRRNVPILPAVFLPPPEETGAKAPAPKPVAAPPVDGAPPAPVNPSMAAADIIKSRMARRPPPGGGK